MSGPLRKTFSFPSDNVLDAALKAISELRFKIDSVDRPNGLINFKTGMSFRSWGQEMSLLVTPGEGECSVEIGKRLRFGLLDWGEGASIAGKVFDLIAKNTRS